MHGGGGDAYGGHDDYLSERVDGGYRDSYNNGGDSRGGYAQNRDGSMRSGGGRV